MQLLRKIVHQFSFGFHFRRAVLIMNSHENIRAFARIQTSAAV
jgi:hypothetical protein